jgi:hypothetical protein
MIPPFFGVHLSSSERARLRVSTDDASGAAIRLSIDGAEIGKGGIEPVTSGEYRGAGAGVGRGGSLIDEVVVVAADIAGEERETVEGEWEEEEEEDEADLAICKRVRKTS